MDMTGEQRIAAPKQVVWDADRLPFWETHPVTVLIAMPLRKLNPDYILRK